MWGRKEGTERKTDIGASGRDRLRLDRQPAPGSILLFQQTFPETQFLQAFCLKPATKELKSLDASHWTPVLGLFTELQFYESPSWPGPLWASASRLLPWLARGAGCLVRRMYLFVLCVLSEQRPRGMRVLEWTSAREQSSSLPSKEGVGSPTSTPRSGGTTVLPELLGAMLLTP